MRDRAEAIEEIVALNLSCFGHLRDCYSGAERHATAAMYRDGLAQRSDGERLAEIKRCYLGPSAALSSCRYSSTVLAQQRALAG
jgi:hypothetical protein